MHRAGAALRDAAAVLGSGEADLLADHPEQGRGRVDVDLVGLAIDREAHSFLLLMPEADAAGANCIVGKYEPKLSVCHYPAVHNAVQQENGNAKASTPSIIEDP